MITRNILSFVTRFGIFTFSSFSETFLLVDFRGRVWIKYFVWQYISRAKIFTVFSKNSDAYIESPETYYGIK